MVMKPPPNYPDCPDLNSFESGVEYQDFVCVELAKKGIILQNLGSKRYQLAVGENIQGFEIKMDRRSKDTGRLSIEIAEKSRRCNPNWVPSGIYRNDNTWLYLQGNDEFLYIFQKSLLILLHQSDRYEPHEAHGTIKAFFLPLGDADKYCALKLEMKRQTDDPESQPSLFGRPA